MNDRFYCLFIDDLRTGGIKFLLTDSRDNQARKYSLTFTSSERYSQMVRPDQLPAIGNGVA